MTILTYGEDASLKRAGARAAAGGLSWQSNPYLVASNMPSATGQSLNDWCQRHDAWQTGFEDEMSHPTMPHRARGSRRR
jgi:hypothetical protein